MLAQENIDSENGNIGSKILIVDDEPDIREIVKLSLEKEDKKVKKAKNGLKALELLKKESFNLILLDINMPKLDGWETAKEIRKNSKTRDVPIAMFTVEKLSLEKIIKKDLKGIVEYIEKPFNREEIVKKVEDIFANINKTKKHEKMILESDKGDKSLAKAYTTWTKTSMIHERFLKKLKEMKEETFEVEKSKQIKNLIEGEKNMINHLYFKRKELLRLVEFTDIEPV